MDSSSPDQAAGRECARECLLRWQASSLTASALGRRLCLGSKTTGGQPWIGVACQSDGADLWFPVKDHPSDEPDTVSLHFTVPEPLVVASNGTLEERG